MSLSVVLHKELSWKGFEQPFSAYLRVLCG